MDAIVTGQDIDRSRPGTASPLETDSDGRLRVVTSAGGNSSIASQPNSVSRLLSAAGTANPTIVKASAGALFGLKGYVARASAVYLKLYNVSGTPVVGDTPVETLYLPPLTAFVLDYPGLYFATGIGYRMTTAAADADTGVLTVGDVVALNVEYA